MKILEVILATIGALALSNGPFAAELFQNGPYYAQPSWDQKLPAATRFVVLSDWNNEAVLDRETGLLWERNPDMSQNVWWWMALSCRLRGTGGRRGWRMPAFEELTSLLDPGQSFPALPAGHPFQGIGPTDQFWSATTYEGNSDAAYALTILDFFNITPAGKNDESARFRSWCVRGGHSASNPAL